MRGVAIVLLSFNLYAFWRHPDLLELLRTSNATEWDFRDKPELVVSMPRLEPTTTQLLECLGHRFEVFDVSTTRRVKHCSVYAEVWRDGSKVAEQMVEDGSQSICRMILSPHAAQEKHGVWTCTSAAFFGSTEEIGFGDPDLGLRWQGMSTVTGETRVDLGEGVDFDGAVQMTDPKLVRLDHVKDHEEVPFIVFGAMHGVQDRASDGSGIPISKDSVAVRLKFIFDFEPRTASK